MISESITVLILLVVLSSPGQSSSNITSSVMSSPSVGIPPPLQSSQIITPSRASASQGLPSTSASVNTTRGPTTKTDQTGTPTGLTTKTDQTGTPTGPTTKTDQTGTPTGPTPTPSETSLTCAKLSVIIVKWNWDEMLANKSSYLYKIYSTSLIPKSLSILYNNSEYVQVTEVTFKKTEVPTQVLSSATLCLIVEENGGESIEDKFINKVKSGELPLQVSVKNDSATFEPIGVDFTDWEAKDGECKNKCEGAAGPFDIERKCQAERYSCNGLKNKSDKSDDCVKYCHAAITVPSFILAIGIFLFFSFQ